MGQKETSMFIATRIEFDWKTSAVIFREGYIYAGPISLCKGDSTAQAMETGELGFQQQLQNIFSAQYATQTATLAYLNNKMT